MKPIGFVKDIIAEKLVAAPLTDLCKTQRFQKTDDISGANGMQAGQATTSTCCRAPNFIRGASCSAKHRAMTSRMRGTSSSRVRACV